jgi:MFS family permease
MSRANGTSTAVPRAGPAGAAVQAGDRKLAVLLSMAMFVLVVDTSLMNVSISSVVSDLHTTTSGVQSAIALEALVSATFILIGSKVADIIGRKRAYVIGLLAYALGALAMSVAQSLTAIIVFWAMIGGLGASLLLPAMQSLIHGNFTGRGLVRDVPFEGSKKIDAVGAVLSVVGMGGVVLGILVWQEGGESVLALLLLGCAGLAALA